MRIGIDLGGTKIEALALDSSGGERFRKRVPTPGGDYEAVVRAISGLVADCERELDESFSSIGIGTPGSLSPATGLIQNSNSTCLIGKPLDRDLERALSRPVRMANDADCFALSEATDGAAAGAETVFGVILGTGVGGGIVARGKLVSGPNAIAGEWGHNPLPWPADEERPGPECYCGKRGCVESFLSGPGLERDYRARGGERIPAAEVARRAAGGDETASAAMAAYEDRLSRALASVINVVDPHVIVLGGGVSNIARLYDWVPRLWGKYVFSTARPATRLVKAKYGDSSGVRGAAWL